MSNILLQKGSVHVTVLDRNFTVNVAGAHHDTGRLAVDRSEYEAQLREQQHQEDVLRRLADPSTPEGVVAQKAYRRVGELLEELKLDEGHLELATQAGCSLITNPFPLILPHSVAPVNPLPPSARTCNTVVAKPV